MVTGGDHAICDDFMSMVERELTDVEHIKREGGAYTGKGRLHFHSVAEPKSELFEVRSRSIEIHGVVGGA